jgi:Glycosyl transferase family 2
MKDRSHGGIEDNSITFVITSCGRFDLLEHCLSSFRAFNTAPICRYVLVEDSGDHGVHEVVAKFDLPIEVIVNDPPLGQIGAIDRAYQSVATPYIFHCEDDWRFFRFGFIEESLTLLKHDPLITGVLCRRPGQNLSIDLIFERSPQQSVAQVRYRKPSPWLVQHWLGYAFNPGLCRLSDYRLLGSFSRWGHAIDASLYFKLRGRTIAILDDPACETTGQDRRVPKQMVSRPLRARWQFFEAEWRYKLPPRLDLAIGSVRRKLT